MNNNSNISLFCQECGNKLSKEDKETKNRLNKKIGVIIALLLLFIASLAFVLSTDNFRPPITEEQFIEKHKAWKLEWEL